MEAAAVDSLANALTPLFLLAFLAHLFYLASLGRPDADGRELSHSARR